MHPDLVYHQKSRLLIVGCTDGNFSLCLLRLSWMFLAHRLLWITICPQSVPSHTLLRTWKHRPFLHALMNIHMWLNYYLICGSFYLYVSCLKNNNLDTNSESDSLYEFIEERTTLKWVSGPMSHHLNLLYKKGDKWTPKASHGETLRRSHRCINVLCWFHSIGRNWLSSKNM